MRELTPDPSRNSNTSLVKILIIVVQWWLTFDFIVCRCHVEAMGEPQSRKASQQVVGLYLGSRWWSAAANLAPKKHGHERCSQQTSDATR